MTTDKPEAREMERHAFEACSQPDNLECGFAFGARGCHFYSVENERCCGLPESAPCHEVGEKSQ